MKITVRSPVAVAYLAQAPGALGLARAYVAGQLDVEGDMYEALTRMTRTQAVSLSPAEKWRLLQALGGPKADGHVFVVKQGSHGFALGRGVFVVSGGELGDEAPMGPLRLRARLLRARRGSFRAG